jgi:hypothetical protein
MTLRKINITGKVTVKQGDTIIFESKPNKILVAGYKYFVALFLAVTPSSTTYFGSQKGFTIKFGTGTADTTSATTALTTIVAVEPVIKTGSGITGSGSRYETHFIATWVANALNAISGTTPLAEIGLYFGLNSTYPTATWTTTGVTFTQQLFSRILLGTDAFVPDTSKPVTVDWCIGVDFV